MSWLKNVSPKIKKIVGSLKKNIPEGLWYKCPSCQTTLYRSELEKNSDVVTGVINNICERKNYVLRKSVNLSKQTHILASNIDIVFLIRTIYSPVTSTNFIDRFLLT